MQRELKGRRIAALAADGFEKVDVRVPMYALRLAGAKVDVISLRHGRIRGVNLHEPASRVGVDKTVEEADPDAYDALLLPGGFVNPDLLRQSQRARDFVRQFDALERPIATLCHGPEVLISADLIKGRRLTSWPGIADDVRNAGGTWEDSAVVRDRNWVASRSPLDLVPFCNAMIDLFDAEGARDLAPAPRRVRYVARVTPFAKLAGIGAAVLAGRAALRSLGARRLSIGLLGGAAVVTGAGRIL